MKSLQLSYDPVDLSKYTNKIILTEALNGKLEKMIKNSGQWIWTIIGGNKFISCYNSRLLPLQKKRFLKINIQ